MNEFEKAEAEIRYLRTLAHAEAVELADALELAMQKKRQEAETAVYPSVTIEDNFGPGVGAKELEEIEKPIVEPLPNVGFGHRAVTANGTVEERLPQPVEEGKPAWFIG